MLLYPVLRSLALQLHAALTGSYVSGTHSIAFINCLNEQIAKDIARYRDASPACLLGLFESSFLWRKPFLSLERSSASLDFYVPFPYTLSLSHIHLPRAVLPKTIASEVNATVTSSCFSIHFQDPFESHGPKTLGPLLGQAPAPCSLTCYSPPSLEQHR